MVGGIIYMYNHSIMYYLAFSNSYVGLHNKDQPK